MTIRPVTSVNLVNSYNQVNFSGKRKNVSEETLLKIEEVKQLMKQGEIEIPCE